MTNLPEIIRLLTQLASAVRRSHGSPSSAGTAGDSGGEPAAAISALAASLSSGDGCSPRVRVLDAALSLLCFNASEVCGARIDFLVRTIVSVLSSSISCEVLRSKGGDTDQLRVGSSISSQDCCRLIRVCADVLESLGGLGGHSHTLSHEVLKVAISASSYQSLFPSSPMIYEENEETHSDNRTAVSKLVHFLPRESVAGSHETPWRLLLWYLDPLSLKHDISEILREAIQRPFLCLRKELHDRLAWRTIVVCLATSPIIFIETRALLHSWFLVTGMAMVLDLKIGVVSSVLDILSRPMWWGVSLELGLRYPFLDAYFPTKHHELLAILTGHMSCKSFLDLVQYIKTMVPWDQHLESTASHPLHGSFGKEALVDTIHNDSAWAMVMDFPCWFYFATALIFQVKASQSYLSIIICDAVKCDKINEAELHQAAAQFLSWVLSPIDETLWCVFSDHISKLSRLWTDKCKENSSSEQRFYLDKHCQKTVSRRKKLRIPKVNDCGRKYMAAEVASFSPVGEWLEEFNRHHVHFCSRATAGSLSGETETEQNAIRRVAILYARIPLGILIMCPSYLDEKGCELLLHYAATGEILQLKEVLKETEGCPSHNDFTGWSRVDARNWALEGSCLVFNFVDCIEDISVALFDCEDTRINFVIQTKGNTTEYLLRCLKLLIALEFKESYDVDAGVRGTMVDLRRRFENWRKQGREMFEGCKEFDDIFYDLSKKFPLF